MTLNPYQRNSIEAGLRRLEQNLCEARLLMAVSEQGRLFFRPQASAAARQRLTPLIEQALNEIAVVAERFQLEAEVDDPLRDLSSEMAVAWADLNGLQSAKLGGYGAVDPALKVSLDPHIERLIQLASQIMHTAREAE